MSEDDFRPLRLQNGWYIQRYAPMLRIAVPYGEIASRQLRVIARIAREYDQPDAELFERAQHTQSQIGGIQAPALVKGVAHFTTRQNIQFNWIPLVDSADVMDLLATVDMHGIQTSGNCIRNITTDGLAGAAEAIARGQLLAIKPVEMRSLRDARSLLGFALFAPFATFLLDQGPVSLSLGLVGAVTGFYFGEKSARAGG